MFISLSLVSFCRRPLKLNRQQYTTQDGEKQDVGEEIDHVLRYVLSCSSPTLRTLSHLSTYKRILKDIHKCIFIEVQANYGL